MLNKRQGTAIATQFLHEVLPHKEWYQHIASHIKAALLYGSVAKGTNRPNSDIDILLILPLGLEESYTDGEYMYDYKGYEINIVLRSIERLRHIATEHTDTYQKEVFRDTVILKSNSNKVNNLLQTISTI